MSYGYGFHPAPYAAYAPAAPGYGYRRSAPPSVHVFAILQYIGGAFYFLMAAVLGVMATGVVNNKLAEDGDFTSPAEAQMAAAAGAVLFALVGLVIIVLARKLQSGRQWARVLHLIPLYLFAAGIVAAVISSQEWAGAAVLVFPGFHLLLLNTRAARSWFRAHTW